jgi:hypothetical protein
VPSWVLVPLTFLAGGDHWLPQADPVLQVVGETSPQHLHLHLSQAAHVKLPQPELALNPRRVAQTMNPKTILGAAYAGFACAGLD